MVELQYRIELTGLLVRRASRWAPVLVLEGLMLFTDPMTWNHRISFFIAGVGLPVEAGNKISFKTIGHLSKAVSTV